MIIKTEIAVLHKELIKIFFQANNLVDTEILEVLYEENDKKYPVLEIVCHDDNDDSTQMLTLLGLRNYGVQNMLDDFLIRCGVHPREIKPYNLVRDREDYEVNQKFEEFYKKIKKA
jgi:hypothetical protein